MKKIFSIAITHEFFDWREDNNLDIQADQPTCELLKRFELSFIKDGGSLQFFVGVKEKEIKNYLAYIIQVTGQAFFEFKLIPQNGDFYQYTHLPDNFIGRLFFNSSFTKNTEADKEITMNYESKESGDFREFAVVRIYLKDLSEEVKKYNIKLSSKKTSWEYYVINSSGINFDNLSIKGNNNIQFSPGKRVMLENGQEAISFKMKGEPIPLTEQVIYRFNLLNRKTNSTALLSKSAQEKVIFKGLPNPKPSEVKIVEQEKESHLSSPIYVYV